MNPTLDRWRIGYTDFGDDPNRQICNKCGTDADDKFESPNYNTCNDCDGVDGGDEPCDDYGDDKG